MATTGSTTLGVLGYLPGHSDFVRVRAADREVRRLEDWLERGLHQARWDLGAGFAVTYPRLFHRFVYRPDNGRQVVAGVLCASVDCHGRPFPFVAFDLCPAEVWDRAPATLLSRNNQFFTALEGLVRAVGPLSHIGQVHGQVAATPAVLRRTGEPESPGGGECGDDEARYENFLQETSCGELGEPGASAGVALFHDLLALLGNGQDPRLCRQALALPLCRPAFARELELRFYLSFLSALLAGQRPTVTLFWQLGVAAPGRLLVSLREPSLDVFSALLGGASSARGVCRPGTGVVPLGHPCLGLTGATTLHTLFSVIADATQRTGVSRPGRNGIRS